MLRYIGAMEGANKLRLYPTDPVDILKVDEVCALEQDIDRMILPSLLIGMRPAEVGHRGASPEAQKETQAQLRATVVEEDKLPRMLGYLEKILAENNTGYFVGCAPTIADRQVLPRLRQLTGGNLTGFPTTILEKSLSSRRSRRGWRLGRT